MITVPNTFIATTEAISQVGVTPIFVDIDERTYNMHPQKLDDYLKKRLTNDFARLTSRPKAVLPVPLHFQHAGTEAGYKIGDLPISERCASEFISLPMYPGLTYERQQEVVDRIKEFAQELI